jgi:oligopeptide/dipeptide ABC transporter ATP-binding protein
MLDVIGCLQSETGTSVVLITHDLGVIAEATRDVAVMYAGRIVERSPTRDLFSSPLHPYTMGLMGSRPRLDGPSGRDALLRVIPGAVPPLYDLPAGCPFQDRCLEAFSVCREKEPVLKEISEGHAVCCWKYGEC